MMAPSLVPQAPVNDLWARAAAELSDDDKRNINFNRPDKLNILAELHEAAEKSRQRSMESRWTYTRKSGETVIVRDVFEKIVRWIDMFKQVGDVAVRYDPAYASLPWAGIRLVLQIAVNDSNKLGLVVEGLARIAELICRLTVTEALYLQGTSKAVKELERAVVKLYANILGYLSKAKQYLEQGTAKRMFKSAVLTKTQFDSGLNDIRTAENDVDRCMALADRNESVNNYTKLTDLLTRIDAPLRRMDNDLNNIHDDLQACRRAEIVRWLSPEPYIQHHKQATRDILTGTGQWLLSDTVFKEWKDDSTSSILWLHGIPGSGKSKLVSIAIEDALKRFKAGDSPQPVFFYCSRNPAEPARSDPNAIFASLARQLSCLEPGKPLLRPTVELFKKKEEEGFASGLLQMDESLTLVLQLIAQYPLTTIIIDAMDECNPRKRHELLKALEQIIRDSSSLVKIFVSSRNDQDIVLRLQHYPNLEIDSRRNGDDIARFVKNQTEQLIQDGELLQYSTSQVEMKKLIVDEVIKGATGMFRWASMQLQYLCSFDLDADIKSSLGRLPPDLHTLYAELYEMLSTKPGKVQAIVFKNVLRWLLCAQRTLKTEEFLCAVSMDPQSGKSVSLASKDLVLKICNNFIVFDSQLDTFRFAHLSVREFLEQRPAYNNSTINALAAEICLWTLLSTSSNFATEELLLQLGWHTNTSQARLGKLRIYADIYWAAHCKSARGERSSGRLKMALKHILSGGGEASSSITQWNDRLWRGLLSVRWLVEARWDVRMALEDTVPTANSALFAGLLIACAFDFEEYIEDMVGRAVLTIQCVNTQGRSPLHVAARNGSCASLSRLLEQDRQYIEITEGVVKAAAGNRRSGKEVMALLLNRRGADVRITEEVVKAAAGNWSSGKEVMALLLDQQEVNIQIIEQVIVLIIKSFNKNIVILLFNRQEADVQITKKVVKAAIEN
ncbi:hypothetical protein AOQ84DRAFT_389280 [Glonium stellatum]|uniref:NACHT domain-containing protein n=1 Tax=Glonium stellatum TaxID=574774 RepID=A0A8E2JSE8_9PEZI|nr:hypothetical protein AOQ84DRAFT_389280 [Glonium stellatum]